MMLMFMKCSANVEAKHLGCYTPYAGKYNTLKMLEEQCPMSFSAGNLSSIVAAKFLGS